MEEQALSVVIAEEQEEIDSIVAMLKSMKRNLDGTETLVRQGRVKRSSSRRAKAMQRRSISRIRRCNYYM